MGTMEEHLICEECSKIVPLTKAARKTSFARHCMNHLGILKKGNIICLKGNRHYLNYACSKVSCDDCNALLSCNRNNIMKHVKTVHLKTQASKGRKAGKTRICDICESVAFTEHCYFVLHWVRMHQDEARLSRKTTEPYGLCDDCPFVGQYANKLAHHAMANLGPSNAFTQRRLMVTCDLCEQRMTRSAFTLHFWNHGRALGQGRNEIKISCDDCGRITTKANFKWHLRAMRAFSPKLRPSRGEKNLTCDNCSIVRPRSKLYRHSFYSVTGKGK